MSEIKLVLSGVASAAAKPEADSSETFGAVSALTNLETFPPGETPEPALNLAPSEELSSEDYRRVDQLAQQINLRDSTSILHYGKTAQDRYKALVDSAFYDATRRDAEGVKLLLKQMGKLIGELSSESIRGDFVSKFFSAKWMSGLQLKYTRASKTIDQITKVLEGRRLALLVDIRKLDDMEQELSESYINLSVYIAAGRQKLNAVKNGELQQLRQQAETTGQQQDVFAYNNLVEQCNCLEGRLQSLELTRNINLQGVLGNQLTRQLDKRLAQSVQDSISNAVTAWKQGIAAVFIAKQSEAVLKEHNATLLGLINDIVGEEPTESR